ncbi:MAG: hypothetical protein RLZZ230_227 [Candidatus Parcubacteria bacterium]|jgi:murein DD-endopeptidase MepM/ murein hydrolase activator NlpD
MKKYIFLILLSLLFSSNSYAAGFLEFPALGYTKSTASVTAVMDHDNRWNYIKTFKGQVGSFKDGCLAYVGGKNVTCDPLTNSSSPWSYKRLNGAQWSVSGLNYTDMAPGTNVYMWYDNHKGYDFAVPEDTPVIAAASGTLGKITTSWGQVAVIHNNGYKTTYTHMQLNLPLPLNITKGSILGWVSDVAPSSSPVGPHLHFVVERNTGGKWYVVDPYGGSGESAIWE